MMYQQDWLMRQIEAISAVIAYLLTGKKAKSASLEEVITEAAQSDMLYRHLSELVRRGQICEAENELFAATQDGTVDVLNAAMTFYADINKLSDEELEEHNFSRKEILDGIRDICAIYNIQYGLFL